MLKIRAIQDKEIEDVPQFVCIDNFEGYKDNESYYFGVKVYDYTNLNDVINKTVAKDYVCYDSRRNNLLYKHKQDIYLLPDVTMYLKLGDLLMHRGEVFNKKLGRFLQRKRRE